MCPAERVHTAKSPNAKMVVIGNTKDGPAVIFLSQ
jgi:hypothetical protein